MKNVLILSIVAGVLFLATLIVGLFASEEYKYEGKKGKIGIVSDILSIACSSAICVLVSLLISSKLSTTFNKINVSILLSSLIVAISFKVYEVYVYEHNDNFFEIANNLSIFILIGSTIVEIVGSCILFF